MSEPVVVFEVLSDSTMNSDVVLKNAEYRATPSIKRYVILQEMQAGATVFARKGEDWVADMIMEGGILHMPEIGIEIPLLELYDGIDLSEEDAAPAA